MSEFDPSKVTMKMNMHLNGGSAFNKSFYDVFYGRKKIAQAVKGREGKEQVFKMVISGEEFCMRTQKEEAISAIKNVFIDMMRKGEIK